MSQDMTQNMIQDMATPADTGITELSDAELATVDGGTGLLSLGDGFDSLFQSSGSAYSNETLMIGQGTFAGPGGSGTLSTIGYNNEQSAAFQTLDIKA